MTRLRLADVPELAAAIDALGATDVERAQALGVTDRSLRGWRQDGLPMPLLRFLAHPSLAEALALAARRDNSAIPQPTP